MIRIPHLLTALCLLATPAFGTSTSRTIYLDHLSASDPGSTPGSATNPYTTLASAITAAQQGDTIIVRPGNYPQDTTNNLNISREVHLRGEHGATLQDANQEGHPILFFLAGAKGSTVEGLTFDGQHGSAAFDSQLGLLEIECPNIRVSGCVFRSGRDSGVRILGSPDCTVENCDIHKVAVGIYVEGASNRVRLLGNRVYNGNNATGGRGIEIHDGLTQAIVDHNQISSVGEFGIEAFGVHSNLNVSNNSITNVGTGISFDHPNYSLINGNTIYGTTSVGIELADGCQHVTASNNVIHPATGGAYSVTSINLSANTYIPSVAINIVGGEASGGTGNLLHTFGQGDVHVSGGVWSPSSTNAAFELQGSGGNSIEGATIHAQGNTDVMEDYADTGAVGGTDFRNNLIIGTPNQAILKYLPYNGGSIAESDISGNHVIGGPFPAGFLFVQNLGAANLAIKNNTPENTNNQDGFADTQSALPPTLHSTADPDTFVLSLNNPNSDGSAGQAVGISFSPYPNGAELASVRAVIKAASYSPTDLEFYTYNGYNGGERKVATFGADLSATFEGAVTLKPVSSVPTPSVGVTLYCTPDGVLHAKDSSGNDHALWQNTNVPAQ